MNPWIEQIISDNLTIVYVYDLARDYADSILTFLVQIIIHRIHHNSFKEYAIIFYVTPLFSKVEGIMIQFVIHQYHIMQLLIKLSLFKRALTLETISNHIFQTLCKHYGLILKPESC